MAQNRLARGLAGLSFLLAAVALLFLVFWPYAYEGESVQVSPNGEAVHVESSSLIEENGIGIIWALIFPAGVASAGLAASFRANWGGKIVLWAAAVLLTLFAWATGLTIGLFYFPSALALLGAAVFHTRLRYAG